MLAALDFYLQPRIVVVSEGPGRDALLKAARTAYAPTLAIAGPWAVASLLEGKTPAPDGSARAFVCSATACSPPAPTAEKLVELLTIS